ncbi:MAG: LacI family DNA-binding transcriptional regulator [Oceanipulchritudo sp.]
MDRIPGQRIGLKEIAAATGLSMSAVSAALRETGRLAPATRERVKAAAAQLGYRPDPMMQALVAYRGNKRGIRGGTPLAVLHFMPDPKDGRKLEFYRRLHGEIRRQAEAMGYAAEIFPTWKYPRAGHLGRVLETRGIQGILFLHSGIDCAYDLGEIPLENFSLVSLPGWSADQPFHDVNYNYRDGLAGVLARLHGLGYRKPALILHPRTEAVLGCHGPFLREWFRRNLHQLNRRPLIYTEDNPDYREGWERLKKWLLIHQPDVIITRKSARRLLEYCELSVPGNMGYVNLGVPTMGHPTSGLVFDFAEITRTGLGFLDLLIRTNERGVPEQPISHQLMPRWNPGTTLNRPHA